ncbi:adenosylcobinamide-GDP ribazoletransferase [Phaeobacter sp. B1627]|uniref:adenosylcobinamide-GDP ribazoletransferase n=1 Tax=Phaeobacter sp. B1627 TaxID=2583809 RepID=UPI00111BAB0A|nr:adenosylcobinamide-GDP ribazoletransferase [Phaeobacter sp. B1627]TNJ41765.1 adenosylcobinamide-GDP ribazoletransferase [Phaeobacter sp. B1627]
MRKNDIIATDMLLAFVLLTRLPLPHLSKAAFVHQRRAVWAFPLVGLAVGALATGTAALALLWWPPSVAAGLALLVQILITGAMHEDGLADSADGVWGGFDRARRLEIMKDSHIGTYGVLALLLVTALRWVLLTALLSAGAIWALLALGALSRASLPVMMASLPNARGSGLSQNVGRPRWTSVYIGIAIALGFSLWAVGPVAGVVAISLCPVVLAVRAVARVKIGGQTGDILGATQQITEVCAALVLLAFL